MHLLSPKKPDGTTDWDVVFDDPERGLIALIDRVRTTEALQDCGLIIIKRLFTRKNDQLDVARFNNELNEIISSAGTERELTEIKQKVILMLQRIKAIRVGKAKVYLEEKARNKNANRRSSGSAAANTYKLLNNKKFTVAAMAAMLVLILAIVGLVYWPTDNATPADKSEQQTRLERDLKALREETEKKQAERLKTEQENRTKEIRNQKALEKKQADERIMPPAVVLPGVYVQRRVKGKIRHAKPIMPIFVFADRKGFSRLCESRPKVIDIINVALSKNSSDGIPIAAMDLTKIANDIRKQVNSHLRGQLVSKVLLVTDGKLSHMGTAGDRCTLASKRYFDYIYPPSPQ